MCLQEAYPCLQFDETGIRPDVALIGALARRRVADDEACDWLVRRHTELGGVSPLVWMDGGGSLEPLLSALPEPTRSPPGTPDDGTHEQVAAWIRRGSGGGPTRGADWWADYRERKGGPDPGPEVRVLLESLQRRNPDTAAHD
jgi:hypothetical protein